MKLTWTDTAGNEVSAKVDAHLVPIINVLGLHKGSEFLMLFGGKYIRLNENAIQNRTNIALLYGKKKARDLGESLLNAGYPHSYRVPTAKKFLARYLRSKGLKNADIATRLSSTDVSVRGWLKSDQDRRASSERRRCRVLSAHIDEAVALGLVVRVNLPSGEGHHG
ncbi:hypothetical protein FS827_08345 [Agrobacterium vitis]|uniref:hypothetical protein n=1 Tax=Rhizobium/Agrobacterium group TaxID=227290 RepID=UPI0012E7A552|nr:MULTISPECIES: hypothetical protein [Rhizobium/Agrobacterium group]MCF1461331.1 hypothetical protein [Allorhizobium ampelinum]MCF1471002.1 hypothetical protein [Allorhizobium ampelinum]MVA50569.1 hypothetical protein [Agrobacterium vitis]MVA73351.1 hypothetical protein [Agrobacterium vitis]